MMTRSALVLAAVVASAALVACQDYPEHARVVDAQDPEILGTWVRDEVRGIQPRARLTFRWNGFYEVDLRGDAGPEVVGTYTAAGGRIAFHEQPYASPCGWTQGEYTFVVSRDRLHFERIGDPCEIRSAELAQEWYRE